MDSKAAWSPKPPELPEPLQLIPTLHLWQQFYDGLSSNIRQAETIVRKNEISQKITRLFDVYILPSYPDKKFDPKGIQPSPSFNYSYSHDGVEIKYEYYGCRDFDEPEDTPYSRTEIFVDNVLLLNHTS